MNKLQTLMFNNGERLVPYVSHGEGELIRHRSSYAFFHAVIASDLQTKPKGDSQASIADLGFGTGYGCALLSSLPSSQIIGVDIGPECEIFARQYYPRSNVDYLIQDLSTFIPEMSSFDYVVSRGVLEHVPDGMSLISDIKFNRRVMIDVPYDEAPGNEHHVLTGIREDAFSRLGDCEFFYEDIDGCIYDASCKPENSNMIMVALSAADMPKINSMFSFPIAPVRSDELEIASRKNLSGSHYYFDTPGELLAAVEKAVKETEVVADIGCGIVPMNYFRPKLHFLVEPWKEYSDILSFRHSGDKSVVILRTGALEALRQLADNSVDSIFLLDVIEHMEKEDGRQLILEMERIAREQIVLFTPLGFMPQHVEAGATDGWGLSGVSVQEHRSGWTPDDFSAPWSFYICNKYHHTNFMGEPLDQSFGAFFAICNFEHKSILVPEINSDIRRPLPAEQLLLSLQAELQNLQAQHQNLQTQHQNLQAQHHNLQAAHQQLLGAWPVRLVKRIKRLFSSI